MRVNRRILLTCAFLAVVVASMALRPAPTCAIGNIHIIIVHSTTDPTLRKASIIWMQRLEETLTMAYTPSFMRIGEYGVFGALEPAYRLGGLGLFGVETYEILDGQEARPNNIRRVCREVSEKAGPDDAIMVIIMSHGTVIKENGVLTHGLAPIATSSDNLELGKNGIRRGTILNELKIRPHRLVALITDSCASPAPEDEGTAFYKDPPCESGIAAFPKEEGYLKKFLQEAYGEININSCDYGQTVDFIGKCAYKEFEGSLFVNAFCRFANNGFYLESELNPDDFYKLLRIEHEREVLSYNEKRHKNKQNTLTRFNGSEPVKSSFTTFTSLDEIKKYYKTRKEKITNNGEFGIGERTFLDTLSSSP